MDWRSKRKIAEDSFSQHIAGDITAHITTRILKVNQYQKYAVIKIPLKFYTNSYPEDEENKQRTIRRNGDQEIHSKK